MTSPGSELPNDLAACHTLLRQLQRDVQHASDETTHWRSKSAAAEARILQLETLLAEHEATIVTQQQTIEQLAEDNKLLKRNLFGSRRERHVEDDPSQTYLFDMKTLQPNTPQNESDQTPAEANKKKRTSKGRQRRVFPDFLPREQQQHLLNEEDIPEELRNNPQARRFFKKIGERVEVTPMRWKLIEEYQEVIVLDQPDATTTMVAAKRPPSLITSFAGTTLLAYLTVSRFADHLPYYRLENILARGGIHVDRSTQWRWMQRLAQGVKPLVDLMWSRALQSQVLAMDETPVRELGGVGTTLKGYLWCGVGDANHPYDCFFYSSDRRGIRPQTYLSGFRGYLLADAYVAYERIGELWPEVFKASCWAHARRKFEECHHLGATKATRQALAYFRQLFDIEDMYKQSSPEQRLTARQARSQPIVNTFHEWLENERAGKLPKAKLLGAINYMLNRWESFTRFLACGMLPLDNNAAERALKYPILGRKAWLFVGNPQAGETAATLFTLTKTCNRLHIDPYAYLQDVYARLPTMSSDELPLLLPDNWLKEYPQHLLPQRVQEAIERAQRARERRAARRAAA
jgi:transposase